MDEQIRSSDVVLLSAISAAGKSADLGSIVFEWVMFNDAFPTIDELQSGLVVLSQLGLIDEHQLHFSVSAKAIQLFPRLRKGAWRAEYPALCKILGASLYDGDPPNRNLRYPGLSESACEQALREFPRTTRSGCMAWLLGPGDRPNAT